MLFLDYDGTLVPFYSHPDQARPSPHLLELLRELARVAEVTVISGRNKSSLDQWFEGVPLLLAAGHGAWVRSPEGHWQQPVPIHAEWKERLRPVLQSHAERLSGAFVEEKDASLVWHYRNADPGLAALRTSELLDTLTTLVANLDVQVMPGNKNVEVRTASIHKGAVADRMLAAQSFDFILAVGDDLTDEDLFRALPDTAWTIKVGRTQSVARFSVGSQPDVLDLLERLVSACRVATR
jgi:trehalose 6-phosphate synthase/phosphatase